MKFMHLSDLHLGKKLNEFSLLEDQKYILQQILFYVEQEKPNVVLLAGDIYDKSIPPVEAVKLFDWFLTELVNKKTLVCLISGNHDSGERLSFAANLLNKNGVYIGASYTGENEKIVLSDEYGLVNIYLLPFIKPAFVKQFISEEEKTLINSYHDAMKYVISKMELNITERNILLAHQFVTGAKTCDSENIIVGGLDNIGGEIFADFDYVALGHIHSPQNICGENIRYCGTPLKYSFSEYKQQKSITMVEIKQKGELNINLIPLSPLRELRKIKGTYSEIMQKNFYQDFPCDKNGRLKDFYHITLTDENDVIDAMPKLRSIYSNLLQLSYDNKRTQNNSVIETDINLDKKMPIELLGDFYLLQNNQQLNKEQKEFIIDLLSRLDGE